MIITANVYQSLSWESYNRAVIQPMLAKYGLQSAITSDGQLVAEVNHGRWIVKCECGGAEKMWEEAIFMCMSCMNAQHKHQYRRATFPNQRAQIEKALLKRPVKNRNWQLGETLAQLRDENKEHGEELL